MRFIFAGDDRYYLQQKRKREKEANSGSVKREIIWSKSQAGPSTFLKKKVLEKN